MSPEIKQKKPPDQDTGWEEIFGSSGFLSNLWKQTGNTDAVMMLWLHFTESSKSESRRECVRSRSRRTPWGDSHPTHRGLQGQLEAAAQGPHFALWRWKPGVSSRAGTSTTECSSWRNQKNLLRVLLTDLYLDARTFVNYSVLIYICWSRNPVVYFLLGSFSTSHCYLVFLLCWFFLIISLSKTFSSQGSKYFAVLCSNHITSPVSTYRLPQSCDDTTGVTQAL